ncbi:MAG: tail fiber domain-containing protein [Spirosomaceae bacterium]|nr:tail fiber domain-containing protein [Spirosomataceae bacterium]
MGKNSSSVAPAAIAIGENCMASGDNSTALGYNASTSGRFRSFAIGGHSSNANPQVANTADYQMMMAFHNYRFWTQNAAKYVDFGPDGEVTATGAYNNVSDRRLKKDFKPLANSLSNLLKTSTYHYYWKTDSNSKDLQTGVIAQELREIFPELVHEDDKGMLSVNYVGLIPHLIEAVKELKKENEYLKSQNEKYNERFERIEALLSKSN